MMLVTRLLIVCVLITLCLACSETISDKGNLVKGYVVKRDWVNHVRGYMKGRAFYQYTIDDTLYKGTIIMGKRDVFYYEGDSVLVRVSDEDKTESEIEKLFYRKKKKPVVASGKAEVLN